MRVGIQHADSRAATAVQRPDATEHGAYGRLSFTGAGLRGVGVGVGRRGSGAGGADRVPIRSPLRTLAALIRAR